jgi:heptosyltransferase-2
LQFKNVNSLLIVRLSSLGDILLTTPLIRTVKQTYPDVAVDFVLREEYRDLLRFNPYLRNIYFYKSNKKEQKNLKDTICNNNYELVIDLQNNLRSRLLLKCYSRSTIRFPKKSIDKFLLVHFKINRLKDAKPVPIRYAQTIEGFKLDDKGLDLFTENKPNQSLVNNKRLIGFCPGSIHFTKMWPKKYFIHLGKLLEGSGYKVVLFGGKDDNQICTRIAPQLSSAINLCNDNDILQTAADMKMCDAIYCNDSGLMHTATAVNIPVITFFGSTVREFGFTPYNQNNLILENNSLSCRPCTHIGRNSCPKKHFNCMEEILPQIAFEKLNSVID